MQSLDNNTLAFIALVRAGLWETDVRLRTIGVVNFNVIFRLAQEQSVAGLVAAGLEHVIDVKVPKEVVLFFVGDTLQIEQRNIAMNHFIRDLIERMRSADIYTLLVKGQGIAQCYERPMWRASGDIDLYLSEENFLKARDFLKPHVESFYPSSLKSRRIEMSYGIWVVELHANQRISLSARANIGLDEIHDDLFHKGNVRCWNNGGTAVFLPCPDDDVIIVFTHYLNHFYKGGVGLRQICDWCRLLWTYRDSIDRKRLESRLKSMKLMSEWKAFAAFAVDYLGMAVNAMPFYDSDCKWSKKAERIMGFIMEVGNMGHNRDNSYYGEYPYVIRKAASFRRRVGDLCRHTVIFPFDSLKFFPYMAFIGLKSAIRGE